MFFRFLYSLSLNAAKFRTVKDTAKIFFV